jgi:hypothetical protein
LAIRAVVVTGRGVLGMLAGSVWRVAVRDRGEGQKRAAYGIGWKG